MSLYQSLEVHLKEGSSKMRDLGYLKRIFEHINGLDKFLVPIVYSVFDDHPFQMFPFIAWKDSVKNYKEGTVEILNKNTSMHN